MNIQTEHLPAGLYKCICVGFFATSIFVRKIMSFGEAGSVVMENYAGSFCNGFGCMLMIHIRDLGSRIFSFSEQHCLLV